MSNHDCSSAVGKRGSKKAGPEHDIGACVSLTAAIIVTQVYHPSSLVHKAPIEFPALAAIEFRGGDLSALCNFCDAGDFLHA